MLSTLVDRNLLPDPLLRTGIRRLLRSRLAEEQRRHDIPAFVEQVTRSPLAINTADANQQHCEVPPRFNDTSAAREGAESKWLARWPARSCGATRTAKSGSFPTICSPADIALQIAHPLRSDTSGGRRRY